MIPVDFCAATQEGIPDAELLVLEHTAHEPPVEEDVAAFRRRVTQFLGRLEGRTGRDFRSTTQYDDPFHLLHHINAEKKFVAIAQSVFSPH